MRARVCDNPACGLPLVPGDTHCTLCGTPAPVEPPEEAAVRPVPINEGACASGVTRTTSVIHLSFGRTPRPARLTATREDAS